MHRTMSVSVPPHATDALLEPLTALPAVMGLSVARGASLKPAGDVITIHLLNRGADDVLRLIR